MRVTILGIKTLPAYAGADRVVERLLENFDDHEVTVYLLKTPNRSLRQTANRHYVYIPALPGKHLRAFSFFLLSTLHYLAKGKAEVVHVHNSDFGVFCPLLKLKRAPIIGTCHGEPYARAKWGLAARLFLRVSEGCFMHWCDAVTAVSPPTREWKRDVRVIPNGVSDPEPVMEGGESIGLAPGDYILFACGRLDATKGFHDLLRAYRLLPDVQESLLAIGDFTHDTKYTEAVEREARADQRVVLHRTLLDRATLARVLADARVFVFPSLVEGMSMMLLEAVAASAVIVCSDIPENRAVVGDAYPMLFRAGDPADLARVLADALALDNDVRSELRGALARVARQFRWETIAAEYLSIYQDLVIRNRRTSDPGTPAMSADRG
jgi:glycosyltransferase involved in cell wall biosynthesis